MEITTKFNVGDVVFYIDGKQNIEKAKIKRISITINNEKYCQFNKCNEVSILYELEDVGYSFKQGELFKDFEEFTNTFKLKFNTITNNE